MNRKFTEEFKKDAVKWFCQQNQSRKGGGLLDGRSGAKAKHL